MSGLADRIRVRGLTAGIVVSVELADQVARYLGLLARWNKKINLTALEVELPSDEAIDRLIIEPLAASQFLLAEDRTCLDVGSGGGSPAIPLKLSAPRLELVLVESRARKAAFLSEAARELRLSHTTVEAARLEAVAAASAVSSWADVVTLRAVRVDRGLLSTVSAILKPTGRLMWFGAGEGIGLVPVGSVIGRHRLGAADNAHLAIVSNWSFNQR